MIANDTFCRETILKSEREHATNIENGKLWYSFRLVKWLRRDTFEGDFVEPIKSELIVWLTDGGSLNEEYVTADEDEIKGFAAAQGFDFTKGLR